MLTVPTAQHGTLRPPQHCTGHGDAHQEGTTAHAVFSTAQNSTAQHSTAQHSTAQGIARRGRRCAAQGTVLDIREALEAHPVYSAWLDWSIETGHSHSPNFQHQISDSLRSASCFVATGEKRGRCLVHRYCPDLALGPSTISAGSTKGQRGPTDMGRKSKNTN
jgi:hypothetical protein